MQRRTTKHDQRSAATRERLIAVARTLFAERGYADVGTEEIVHAAGVTRGALYHQFRDKAELFTAVFETVETEIVAGVTSALAEPAGADPVVGLMSGARAFLTACAKPQVERIVLRDAPAVLGADRWQQLSEQYGLGLVQQAVQAMIDAGVFGPCPVAPLARLLLGALNEAARYVSASEDPGAATEECLQVLDRMVAGLRATGAPPR